MMSNKGLTKLGEECGELVQIAMKKIAYPDTDEHPDGKGSMLRRLEDEMGDVIAAMQFVTDKLGLDRERISVQARHKLVTFHRWDQQP